MVDKNDALIREVDEELRREQLEKLWERYSNYVLAVAALIVVGVGGYKFLEGRRIAASAAAGAKFEEATALSREGKSAEAEKLLGELTSAPGGYPALAKLQTAAALVKSGKSAEAVAIYDALSKAGGTDPLIQDFARLQGAAQRVGDADWTEIQNRLNDLASDSGAWRHSARELLGLAALKAGKLDEARRRFEQLLGDRRTPEPLLERVRILMASLVAKELAAKGGDGSAGAAGAAAPNEASGSAPAQPKK